MLKNHYQKENLKEFVYEFIKRTQPVSGAKIAEYFKMNRSTANKKSSNLYKVLQELKKEGKIYRKGLMDGWRLKTIQKESEFQYISCQCGGNHMLRFTAFDKENNEFYFNFYVTNAPFLVKLKESLKYLFKKGDLNVQDLVLSRNEVKKLRSGIDRLLALTE